MIEIRRKLAPAEAAAAAGAASGALRLAFDRRRRSRQRVTLSSGEDALLILPRGEMLRGGDRLLAADGRLFEVQAAPEPVLHVECADAALLARAAYHLGNRHVPVEVGAGYLRLEPDHVLAAMLAGLGLSVVEIMAPFEPEAGAYAQAHAGGPARGHDHAGYAGHIHEYGTLRRD